MPEHPITIERVLECVGSDVKRFTLPIIVRTRCPKCGEPIERDMSGTRSPGGSSYLSYPVYNQKGRLGFYCDSCGLDWSVVCKLNASLDTGYIPNSASQQSLMAVNIILRRYPAFGDAFEILMMRRANTGWEDGKWNLPAGHVDWGEDPVAAAIREAKKEIGVTLHRDRVRVQSTMHHCLPDGRGYMDLFVTADNWDGDPKLSGDKADKLEWVDVRCLNGKDPKYPMVPTCTVGLRGWLDDRPFISYDPVKKARLTNRIEVPRQEGMSREDFLIAYMVIGGIEKEQAEEFMRRVQGSDHIIFHGDSPVLWDNQMDMMNLYRSSVMMLSVMRSGPLVSAKEGVPDV